MKRAPNGSAPSKACGSACFGSSPESGTGRAVLGLRWRYPRSAALLEHTRIFVTGFSITGAVMAEYPDQLVQAIRDLSRLMVSDEGLDATLDRVITLAART